MIDGIPSIPDRLLIIKSPTFIVIAAWTLMILMLIAGIVYMRNWLEKQMGTVAIIGFAAWFKRIRNIKETSI